MNSKKSSSDPFKTFKMAMKPLFFKTPDGKKCWRVKMYDKKPVATPAVSNGAIFLGGGYGSYHFYALDIDSGTIKWVYKTKDDGPTAAIVVDDNVLFNTESCTIYNIDSSTGKEKWSKWLGDPLMSQPAADSRGNVYMAYPDNKNGQYYLACMSIKDGKILWTSAIDTDVITAPIVDNGNLYVTTMKGSVSKFDALTGKRFYEREQQATSAPWLWEGEVFVSVRDDEKVENQKGQVKKRRNKGRSEAILSLQKDSGMSERSELWGYQKADYLEAGADNKQESINKSLDSLVGFSTPPQAAKMKDVMLNIGQSTVAGCWAYQGSRPAIIDGRCYIAMGERLKCIDARSGKVHWEKKFVDNDNPGSRNLTPPSIGRGKLVTVVTSIGGILCIRMSDGEILWKYALEEPVSFQPALWKGKIIIPTASGTLCCIDTGDRDLDEWLMWGGSAAHNGMSKNECQCA